MLAIKMDKLIITKKLSESLQCISLIDDSRLLDEFNKWEFLLRAPISLIGRC